MLRTTEIDGTTWYVAIDLLVALECNPRVTKLCKAIINNVGRNHVCVVPLHDSINRIQATTLISEMALVYALQRSRKPQVKQLAKELGLSLNILVSPIETDTIRIIAAAFAHLKPIEQFFLNGYRIDLYFPAERIAVECDELHHKDNQVADQERELEIKAALKCTFIRYSPCEPGFNIGETINQIMRTIHG